MATVRNQDSFTGSGGTHLTSHTPDTPGSGNYTLVREDGGTDEAQLDGSGAVSVASVLSGSQGMGYFPPADPQHTDQTIKVDIAAMPGSGSDDHFGVAARCVEAERDAATGTGWHCVFGSGGAPFDVALRRADGSNSSTAVESTTSSRANEEYTFTCFDSGKALSCPTDGTLFNNTTDSTYNGDIEDWAICWGEFAYGMGDGIDNSTAWSITACEWSDEAGAPEGGTPPFLPLLGAGV